VVFVGEGDRQSRSAQCGCGAARRQRVLRLQAIDASP
jgi:hypothetical protein